MLFPAPLGPTISTELLSPWTAVRFSSSSRCLQHTQAGTPLPMMLRCDCIIILHPLLLLLRSPKETTVPTRRKLLFEEMSLPSPSSVSSTDVLWPMSVKVQNALKGFLLQLKNFIDNSLTFYRQSCFLCRNILLKPVQDEPDLNTVGFSVL